MTPPATHRRRLRLAVLLPMLAMIPLWAAPLGLLVYQLPALEAAQRARPTGDPTPDARSLLAAAVGLSAALAVVATAVTRSQVAALGRLLDDGRPDEERLSLLSAAMKYYAIFTLDPEGRIGGWNEAAERILGYRADEVTGRHLNCLYNEDEVNAGRPLADLGWAAREGRSEEVRWITRKDGFRFRGRASLVAVRDPDGSLSGFTSVIHEVEAAEG